MIRTNQPFALCPRCQAINVGIQQVCLMCQTPLPAKTRPQPSSVSAAPRQPVRTGSGAPSRAAPADHIPAMEQGTVVAEHRFVLNFLNGAQAGHRFPMGLLTRLGTHPDNTIILDDRLASRRHALIERSPEGYFFIDLNSTNGSYINGSRCEQPVLLKPGMTLVIGSTQIRIEIE